MTAPFSRYRERISLLGKPTSLGPIGRFKRFSNGSIIEDSPVNLTGLQPSKLIERSWDQINPPIRRGSKIFRAGGPFCSIKVRCPGSEWIGGGTYNTVGNPNFGSGSSNRWEYVGQFSNPDLTYDGIPTVRYADGGGANVVGHPLLPSTAAYEPVARISAPPIEKASLANFLFEFRDMPRQMQQTADFFQDLWRQVGGSRHTPFLHPRRAADDFLNVQFGWLPFVGDIAKLCDAVVFSQQYVHDLTKMNNQWVKRKKVILNTESATRLKRLYTPGCEPSGSNVIGICKDMSLDGFTCKGYMDVWDETQTLVWSEGEYKYYRPEFDDTSDQYSSQFNRLNQALTVLGARINPVHIWRAIPWSWTIDWFSRVGENIQNYQSEILDGWVSRDLYLMHQQVRKITSFHLFNFWSGALQLSWTRFANTKQRKVGDSPYGFGLFSKDLSANQWAILTALGISRNVNISRVF